MPRSSKIPVKAKKASKSNPVTTDVEKKRKNWRRETTLKRKYRSLNRGSASYTPILTEAGVRKAMRRALDDQDRPVGEGGSDSAYGPGNFDKVCLPPETVKLARDLVENVWQNDVMESIRSGFRHLSYQQMRVTCTPNQLRGAFMGCAKRYSHEVPKLFNVLTRNGRLHRKKPPLAKKHKRKKKTGN